MQTFYFQRSVHMKRHLLVLNEVSAFRVLANVILRRRIFIVAIIPSVHQLTNPLTRFAEWATRRGLVYPLETLSPTLPWTEGLPGRGVHNDVHHRIEDRLRRRFDVAEDDPALGHLGYAMRKAVTDYTTAVTQILLAVEWLEAQGLDDWTLSYAPGHFFWAYDAYYGRAPSQGRPPKIWPRTINIYVALFNVAIGFVWLSARIRPLVRKETFRLAVDAVSIVERNLLRHIFVDGNGALVVHRNRATAAALASQFSDYRNVMLADARVGIGRATDIFGTFLSDIAQVWRHQGRRDPELFGRFCMLAVKRLMYASFFARFRPAFFWCRDDYSMDHIVRNRELRAVGGRSLGISHGLPMDSFHPNWREIDCDIYYTFGAHLYQAFYKDAWPKGICVKPVGTLQMTPELRSVIPAARPKDIVYFPIVHPRGRQIMEEVFDVARRMPQRVVYVKFKANRTRANMSEFEELTRHAPANVTFVEPEFSAYELLGRVTYCLSSGSTLGAECLQFGVASFVFDVEPAFKNFYYRNFPELIVKDAGEVVARIEGIERGDQPYDFSRLSDLIQQAETDIYDVIRQDLSLTEARA